MNLIEHERIESNKKTPEYMRAFGKEMRRINRNYPIFIYDDYRYGCEEYDIIQKSVIKRRYGYIRAPMYHMLGSQSYTITFDKTITKFSNNTAYSEGDLLFFSDPYSALYYFDYIYNGMKRDLINIPVLLPGKIVQQPAWVYHTPKLRTAGLLVESGDIIRHKKISKNNYSMSKLEKQKLIIIDTIRKLGGENGAHIDDVIRFSGVEHAERIIMNNMKKLGEIYFIKPGLIKLMNEEK